MFIHVDPLLLSGVVFSCQKVQHFFHLADVYWILVNVPDICFRKISQSFQATDICNCIHELLLCCYCTVQGNYKFEWLNIFEFWMSASILLFYVEYLLIPLVR
ncbi:hypothetical protein GW17_00007158 [Ensete ventricosum]|nr:hypothetical protein GW17_00007158 [Ensete ventricosum]